MERIAHVFRVTDILALTTLCLELDLCHDRTVLNRAEHDRTRENSEVQRRTNRDGARQSQTERDSERGERGRQSDRGRERLGKHTVSGTHETSKPDQLQTSNKSCLDRGPTLQTPNAPTTFSRGMHPLPQLSLRVGAALSVLRETTFTFCPAHCYVCTSGMKVLLQHCEFNGFDCPCLLCLSRGKPQPTLQPICNLGSNKPNNCRRAVSASPA